MKMQKFLMEIELSYNRYFKDSKCSVRHDKRFYNSVDVTCFLAGSKEENSGNYWENDMFGIRIFIESNKGEFDKNINLESELPELVLIVDRKRYFIKPKENQNLVYENRILKFRKTKGDAEKILKTFDKYFSELHKQVKEDLENGNIHKNYVELVKNKI